MTRKGSCNCKICQSSQCEAINKALKESVHLRNELKNVSRRAISEKYKFSEMQIRVHKKHLSIKPLSPEQRLLRAIFGETNER